MKIKNNTPDLLIIDNAPWLLSFLLAGSILMPVGFAINALFSGDIQTGLRVLVIGGGFGALFFAAFVSRDQLVLDRRDNRVEMRRRTLFRQTSIRHDLRYLRRAIVQTSRSDNSDTHRMTLELDGGMDPGLHPFTTAYTSGKGARRGADAVNAWLAAQPVDSEPQQP